MCECNDELLYDQDGGVDPLGDAERLAASAKNKNYARVGSARPSSLMYTYGPGSVMDMAHFTVLPMGLDDWDRIWARRSAGGVATVHAPRLLQSVRTLLGRGVEELRPFPWQPSEGLYDTSGNDLGVPARPFPQWLRCTHCDKLAPIGAFEYRNTKPNRPDEACYYHVDCRGKDGRGKKQDAPCVPARYVLACANGHLDEFPYDWWVHRGEGCPAAQNPDLRMHENPGGRGSGTVIECASCGKKRGMNEAQGEVGRKKLPRCRGRHAHLDAFDRRCCDAEPRLMLVGASNLWFPVLQSIVDMPQGTDPNDPQHCLDELRGALGPAAASALQQGPSDKVVAYIRMSLDFSETASDEVKRFSDAQIRAALECAAQPPQTEAERQASLAAWDPVDLLVPEWRYLQNDPVSERQRDGKSGLVLSPRGVAGSLADAGVSRVLAVDSLRKVTALVGFTRIDEFDRAADAGKRLVRLVRSGTPKWVPATEDRGEGVYLQLDEERVARWEERVEASEVWQKHRAAWRRYAEKRLSETARTDDLDDRLPPARYWLVHTLAHGLIRRMAASSGYGIPSIAERLYAWKADPERDRPAAAGLLVMTAAADSEGTLGGLVALSEPGRLEAVMQDALHDMLRCSSDPVCARRTPEDPEDFLHGAACHCCTMLSETSCERANRFLDRRFVVPLPGYTDLAFFENVHA